MPRGVYEGNKGKIITQETRKKISQALKGIIPKNNAKLIKLPKTDEWRRKMSEARLLRKEKLGYLNSPETREKMSNAHKGEKSAHWKGDDVVPHHWIEKKLGKPRYCEHCKRTDRKVYDWSNKNHKYIKIIEDWQRLCRKCHIAYDVKYNNYKKKKDIKQ
jgi:hypothetical protein